MAVATAVRASLARRGGFFHDTRSVAERALRSIPRDPESTIPALLIPVFMYVVTVGALNDIAEEIPGLNYRALPNSGGGAVRRKPVSPVLLRWLPTSSPATSTGW